MIHNINYKIAGPIDIPLETGIVTGFETIHEETSAVTYFEVSDLSGTQNLDRCRRRSIPS